MNKNNITLQASLDTSQLKKDLEKFQGEVSVTADRKKLKEQIESAIKDASLNSSATIRCNVAGLENISRQVGNATSQLQGLGQTAAALNRDINLRVTVDSSGLQQYTAQMEKSQKISMNVQTPSIHDLQSHYFESPPSSPASFGSYKQAEKESGGFLDALGRFANIANGLGALVGANSIFKSFQKLKPVDSENLD